jgi:type IV secretion system protein VirD4
LLILHFIQKFSGLILFILGLIFSIYIGGLSFAVSEFGHQQTLTPVFIKSLMPFSYLLTYGLWWQENLQSIPFNYNNYFVFRYSFSVIVPLVIYVSIIWYYRKGLYKLRPFQKLESIHGDARWATEADIKKAGLREKKGMLVGCDDKGFLVAGGYQHTLLFAPTGSGKSFMYDIFSKILIYYAKKKPTSYELRLSHLFPLNSLTFHLKVIK